MWVWWLVCVLVLAPVLVLAVTARTFWRQLKGTLATARDLREEVAKVQSQISGIGSERHSPT